MAGAGLKSMIAVFAAAVFCLPAPGLLSNAFAQDTERNPYALIPDAIDRDTYRHKTLASNSTEPVGVQLVLAMDTSGSMSYEEFAIELQATATALNSELFRNAIKYKAGEQSVAIAVIDFDHVANVRVKWVDIRGKDINDKPYNPDDPLNSSLAPDKLDALSQEVLTIWRQSEGGTVIGKALNLSKSLFLWSPWGLAEGGKRVLDVFGDGASAYDVRPRRDELAALGITINGFAIVNDEPDLEKYFEEFLVTNFFIKSPDGFYSEPGRVWAVARNLKEEDNDEAELASFFGEVTRAMKQKITFEVAGLEGYYRTLAKLKRVPMFSLPRLP